VTVDTPIVATVPYAVTAPPAVSAESAVTVERVSLRFGALVALDEVSLDVAAGEILFLLGPSGSGKSSMLRVVAGLERPASGRVRIDGCDVVGPRVFAEPEERRVGMVFQDYALFPHLTVAANVAFGVRGTAAGERRAIAALLERFGIDRYADSYPHMLSGGERQRVALARALAPRPRILLMDEPFSGLDSGLRDRVRRDTLRLLRDLGTTTIVVTHDPQEALRDADRLALLRAGRVVQCGTPDELYHRPATTFAARFLGAINELAAVCRDGVVATPIGLFSCAMPDGAAVRVCIRPHHLQQGAGPGRPGLVARVVSREFLGAAARLTVALDSSPDLLSMIVGGRAAAGPGDTITLSVDTSHVAIVPDREP
jgi:iron(III) transport system ATP-binding protein